MLHATDALVHTLKDLCERLLGHGSRLLLEGARQRDGDHVATMCFTFAAKQHEHLHSVLALANSSLFADAAAIARIMLEGAALLDWAMKDAPARPTAWCAFSLVFDLRHLHERGEDGTLTADQRAELLRQLQAHGRQFLKKGRTDFDRPDAYVPKWPSRTVAELIQEYDAPLQPSYSHLSCWIHWNARGIGNGIHRDGNRITLKWSTLQVGAHALITALQSYLTTHEHFARFAKLDATKLTELLAECLTLVQPSRSSGMS